MRPRRPRRRASAPFAPLAETPAWVVHLAVGAAGAAGSIACGRSAIATESALGLDGASAAAASVALGGVVAAATVGATRGLLRSARWASALAADLRPHVEGRPGADLLARAIAPAVGEELFFRGCLVPLLASAGAGRAAAVVVAAAAFGALHQVRGRGRWAWALSAAALAIALGAVFVASGSLAGCVVAHAAINAHNLRLVREHAPPRKRRRLGGLLQDR